MTYQFQPGKYAVVVVEVLTGQLTQALTNRESFLTDGTLRT